MRDERFPEPVEGAAYFLVCEGFTDAPKHSRAERVTVRLHRRDGRLDVDVSDDGAGFDPERTELGGLRGLEDRVDALGGTLRVVLAEAHFLVREGTRRLLEDSGEVEVIAAAGTPAELHAAVAAAVPDVVITDIRMPRSHHMEGIVAAHRLREEYPGLGVVEQRCARWPRGARAQRPRGDAPPRRGRPGLHTRDGQAETLR